MLPILEWSGAGAPSRRGRLVVTVVAISFLFATAVSAEPTDGPGFADGRWVGVFRWEARAEFEDAAGYGGTDGSFVVTWQGGLPAGEFNYLAKDVVGATSDARAELQIASGGYFAGRPDAPLLIPTSLSVTGEVLVYGVDRFPVQTEIGTGELSPIPLDVVRAGCSFVTGTFETRTAEAAAEVAAIGGSLSAQRAQWSAIRTGDAGTSDPEQEAVLNALLSDGAKLIADARVGTLDDEAMWLLVYRAEQLANSIQRNASCNIDTPGQFMTAVAGIMTELIATLVANESQFSLGAIRQAVLAGLASGALGSSAGASAAELTAGIKDVLLDRFTAAAAANNRQDLAEIATIAYLLGDQQLVDLVVEALAS